LVVTERGHVSKSVSATDGQVLVVNKPTGATVRGAYLAYATTGFTSTPLDTPITLAGQPVELSNQVSSGISSYNYFADVTGIIKPLVDPEPAGQTPLAVSEPVPSLVDGAVLTVVFDDPSVQADQTVSVLYGALNPEGDTYRVDLASPVGFDPSKKLEMGLGISFSYQANGTQQFTTVDVEGQRLTTSAGGEDDGTSLNGGLITVGGLGDSPANPVDPTAGPTSPRSDDELYDLTPFVGFDDSSITISTSNPSRDDNIFVAVFEMNLR